MQSDKYLKTEGIYNLLRTSDLPSRSRVEYLQALVKKSKVIHAILSITTLDISSNVTLEVSEITLEAINVTKCFHAFLYEESVVCNEESSLLISLFSDPSVIGVTRALITKALEGMGTPEDAILYLLPHDLVVLPQDHLAICGCCNRGMKSVNTKEGLCYSCMGILTAITKFHAEPFVITTNHINIPRYTSNVDTNTEVNYLDEEYGWEFTSVEGGNILATRVSPIVPYQDTLPIKEYQVRLSEI